MFVGAKRLFFVFFVVVFLGGGDGTDLLSDRQRYQEVVPWVKTWLTFSI